ncbi:MAG: UDP-N-acetylglucosamine 2-epimerase (non-hydrolyzing) [Bacteroidales bacterium]|nr:UDP-N-acetylglucosamine 2-epimerase (non-hydrolyzing) [Bacteroidales bacterium]
MRIISIVGARPQFIKASAISRAFKKEYPEDVEEILIHTGQHYDENMSQIFFDELDLPRPHFNLEIGSLPHGGQTGRMLERIEKLLLLKRPAAVIVYGDTNTTLAGALAASKQKIPVIHIEAGLRSFKKGMPEEINRIMTDHVSTMLFAPTERGVQNLLREGFSREQYPPHTADNPAIYHSGDIMYDNSLHFAQKAEKNAIILQRLQLRKNKFVLSTLHRANNTNNPDRLYAILLGLKKIADSETRVVVPLHPGTRKQLSSITDQSFVEGIKNHSYIDLIDPVSFLDMIMLEKGAEMIITDSGGVQKEAYFFHKPSVILREETEWTEITENNTGILTGATSGKIAEAFLHFRNNPPEHYPDIFGNGNAAAMICEEIVTKLA